jgi:hypothetical protein
MPYEGEFAGYRALQRIVQTERVKNLLTTARVLNLDDTPRPKPAAAPAAPSALPQFVFAIDGSNAEVDVRNGFPGAKIGYCTVASVLLDLHLMAELDQHRPANPVEFRKTEESSAIDAALPGSNVITANNSTARDSFRQSLFEVFANGRIDDDDKTTLLETFEALLAHKPSDKGQACPYGEEHGCETRLEKLSPGHSSCACDKKRSIYSTDALRIHEGFRDLGSNRELLGEVMQVWERILLVHLLRTFEKKDWLPKISKLAFVLDGPLAVFGHPAWLSAAISAELKRLNTKIRNATGNDLVLVGIEKTGEFVTHFDEIDRTNEPGEEFFPRRGFHLLTDGYIKERVKFSDSPKRFGVDTYFGRKLFYKTESGARIVATLPFLSDEQDTLESGDPSLYPQFATVCALLDKLVSSRFPNALAPLISANAQAAIPLSLGSKVLKQLAQALVGESK